jgi:hypothetical protein
MFSALGSPI